MNRELFNDIVAFLVPYMPDTAQRSAILATALVGCEKARVHVTLDGNAQVFTANMVDALHKFGMCTDGELALVRVLDTVGGQHGEDVRARADTLIARVKGQPDERQTLTAGSVLQGKYRLDARLGAGGNGEVWRVHHLLLGRDQAIKILHPRYSAEPERRARFLQEMRTVANFDHPHIIKVYETLLLGTAPHEQIMMVMQYVDGNALTHFTHGKAHPLQDVIGWLAQIAEALDYTHAQGIVHRDVKPDNILRRVSDGRLFLADFGLVLSNADDSTRLTAADTSVGTTRYMAPEQVDASHGKVSAATDLYALGIVAYELLTGAVPFDGSKQDIKEAHRYKELGAQPAYLTDEVLNVLRTACAKQPALRYASATAFIDALRAAAQGKPSMNRVQHYLQSWAAHMDEPIDDEFDMPSLLRGDEQTLQPLPDAQPAPPADPRRARLQNIRQKREAYTEQKGDYQRKEGDVVQAVPNVRERLKDVQHGVLLGQPGSGKSWTLRRLMVDALNDWREVSAATRIPVFVPLNSYDGDVPFAAFVQAQMGDFAAYYESLLNSQRLLLLCDALNEMPNQAKTLPVVKAFLKAHREQLHFIVSCRVLDYQRQLEDLYPLEKVTLRPLELPDIQQFVLRYLGTDAGGEMWAAMGGSATLLEIWEISQSRGELERFWDAKAYFRWINPQKQQAWKQMHAGAGLIPLCRSPFMASLVSELYEPATPLPASRGAIFAGFVRKALDDEAARATAQGNPFPAVDAVQEVLAQLADAMQRAQATVLPRSGQRAPACMAQTALIDAGIAASLLIGDREQVRFAHQLFQEYFAARVLLGAMERGDDPASVIESSKWWEPGVWHETAIILGELANADSVAIWLAPYSPELARLVVFENAEVQAGQKQLSASAKAAIVDAAWDKAKATNAIERAAAYRVLGHPIINADNRRGVGVISCEGVTLPDIDWVDIPAGDFIYGDDNKSDYDDYGYPDNQEILRLPTFKMSRYLVTFAQFQVFIDSGEFDNLTWWEGFPEQYRPQSMYPQTYSYTNHPRDSVSWYQAVAFTRWLTAKYKLSSDVEIRLPTEPEWEYAARGRDGRLYSYGAEFDASKGNTGETDIGQTSAVGIFPGGASPFGVLDMTGNIFEWCLNDSNKRSIINAFSNGKHKVLRGGSFRYYKLRAGAAFIYDYDPMYWYESAGLRLVMAPVASLKSDAVVSGTL